MDTEFYYLRDINEDYRSCGQVVEIFFEVSEFNTWFEKTIKELNSEQWRDIKQFVFSNFYDTSDESICKNFKGSQSEFYFNDEWLEMELVNEILVNKLNLELYATYNLDLDNEVKHDVNRLNNHIDCFFSDIETQVYDSDCNEIITEIETLEQTLSYSDFKSYFKSYYKTLTFKYPVLEKNKYQLSIDRYDDYRLDETWLNSNYQIELYDKEIGYTVLSYLYDMDNFKTFQKMAGLLNFM